MQPARFFVPDLPDGGKILIKGDEAHHMVRVRRLRPGDLMVFFDGRGRQSEARVEKFGKVGVFLEILHTRRGSPELAVSITLATAIAKGSRMDFLLEKAAELGVGRIVPLLAQRGMVQGSGEHYLRRLREACKQCGRNIVPDLTAPAPVGEVAGMIGESDLALLFDPGPDARPLMEVLRSNPGAKSIFALVGPEGGFTEKEREHLRSAGAVPARVSPAVLRVETAAIAAVAAVAAVFENEAAKQTR